jgi:hypothetical protein
MYSARLPVAYRALPDGYRPRGSIRRYGPSVTSQARNRRTRQKPATMSVLQLCNRKAVMAQKFITQ